MFWNRLEYSALLAGAVLFYLFFTEYLSFFTLVFLLLVPVLSFLLTAFAVRKTQIALEAGQSVAQKRSDAVFRIRLTGRFFLPVACVKLDLSCVNSLCGIPVRQTLLLAAEAGRDTVAEYRVSSRFAGKLSVSLVGVRCYDFLGIFSFHKKIDASAVTIVPLDVFPLNLRQRPKAEAVDSEVYSAGRPGSDFSEVFGIRPYREGDRLRSIHWKLSARSDELLVREGSLPVDGGVILLLELLAPGPTELEGVLETAVSVSVFLEEHQVSHSMEWYDAEKEALRSVPIQSDAALAETVGVLLNSGGYRDRALACACHAQVRRGFRVFCITGKLTPDVASFCERAEGATVLYVSKQEDAQDGNFKAAAAAAGIRVVPVRPGKISESLSGLTV